MSGSTTPVNPVTGIPTHPEGGFQYARRDIDDWYNEQIKGQINEDTGNKTRVQLTLFMRALKTLQKREVTDEVSFFRLAAIHGAPFCDWGGVTPKKGDGFCVHNDYTFPTWHRVYLGLYEQELYKAMTAFIDEKVPESYKTMWQQEADAWRLPYWDFARTVSQANAATAPKRGDIYSDRLRLPILCMMPSVRVVEFKDGNPWLDTMDNPIYKYVSRPPMGELPDKYKIKGEKIEKDCEKKMPAFTYPWDKCTATTKYGVLDTFHEDVWADGGQNWLRANLALNEHINEDLVDGIPAPTLQDMVFRLFQSGLDSWGAFSTTHYGEEEKSNPKNTLSVESIHNKIHELISFDPKKKTSTFGAQATCLVFKWRLLTRSFGSIIEFSNVDRLTAIWQALNGSGGQNGNEEPEKWFDDKHSMGSRDDDLVPFRKVDGSFYKSNDVEKWRNLHYDYEILQMDDPTGTKKINADRKTILERVHQLYGAPAKELYEHIPDPNNKTNDKRNRDDYIITLIYDRYALFGAPYTINVFLGDVSKESYGGPGSQGFIGSVYNFSGALENCENCKKQAKEGVKSIAQVPATIAARHFIRKGKDVPQPKYVVLNVLGKPVEMEVKIELHRANRSYYKHPEPVADDPLRYQPIKSGKQADNVLEGEAADT